MRLLLLWVLNSQDKIWSILKRTCWIPYPMNKEWHKVWTKNIKENSVREDRGKKEGRKDCLEQQAGRKKKESQQNRIKPSYRKMKEKAMAPHSSTLAWKIPWMEEPGRLQSMRSLRDGHDWATSLWLFTFMHWRRKWQPTPVFLPGESQGRGSLVGCRLWGRTELDTTEVT